MLFKYLFGFLEKTPAKAAAKASLAESETKAPKVLKVVAEIHSPPLAAAKASTTAERAAERQAWANHSQKLMESMNKSFSEFDREMEMIRASEATKNCKKAASKSMFETGKMILFLSVKKQKAI